MSLTVALQHHLQYNHYPSISAVFVPSAERAIELANEDDWDAMIELPNGVSISVGEIVDQLHLTTFVTFPEDEELEDDLEEIERQELSS
jgi:hypothetical protein